MLCRERERRARRFLGATRFDFLVNNAGNNHRNMPFEKATEEEFDSVYNVHFKGVFLPDAEASPPDQGWRPHRQHIDSADSHCLDPEGRSTPR
jgi:NAD(P)-dependent dehydrogenase (short-subunit alcohol dehydrogenase family)